MKLYISKIEQRIWSSLFPGWYAAVLACGHSTFLCCTPVLKAFTECRRCGNDAQTAE